ncbi:hypothetical protein EBU95_09355 [bacterium]|nr:hypothetical protein [bacterium]
MRSNHAKTDWFCHCDMADDTLGNPTDHSLMDSGRIPLVGRLVGNKPQVDREATPCYTTNTLKQRSKK